MIKTLDKKIFTDSADRSFMVRIVPMDGKYGRDFCLTHDRTEPMVEFYDTRYAHTKDEDGTILGQFVSRYNLETILQVVAKNHGINLHEGVLSWQIGADAISDIGQWINDIQGKS
jgi:hypothetical protein